MRGISDHKAAQLRETYGLNEIIDKPSQTPLQIFVSQFTSMLVILLILAACASLFLKDILDGVFILLIVLLNGILGFIQEYRAEKAIAALKNMTTTSVRVIRSGKEMKMDSKLLVPGDIVFLSEGDKVPADCKLVEGIHMEVNEAALTGESMPAEKNIHDTSNNELFLGTIVTRGRALVEVTATGMVTRFGKIAESLSTIQKEETPLQKRLNTLGKQLGVFAIFASTIVFLIGIRSQVPLIEMILTSISLAVAAVPEGLPAVITITLAVGMQRMAKKHTILRKLASIEALGSTTIIATDKTGTLTKNEMRVSKVWSKKEHELFKAGVICNNASVVYKEDRSSFDILGDTTEGALLLAASDRKLNPQQIKESGELVDEYAFDPQLKLMTVIWKENGKLTTYTKGAPESVLAICKDVTPERKKSIELAFGAYAAKGLRVIAIASSGISHVPKTRIDAEKNLSFLGFVGISDPPRDEVKSAIAIAAEAGIRTIMITGDNPLTAKAIGESIGLLQTNEEIITGAQFASLTDEEAIQRLPIIRIFARTTPDQKLRIVQLLQRTGNIVAVTGDGVNDALALKQSDIGVAMGITGTDVAKEASDMIITDDNYATLVTAVEEGRTIFDNIKSAVKYLVGCNLGEIIAVVVGMLLGWPLILSPLQLLYINLVTDGLPAIALAVTPRRDGIMRKKPRPASKMFDTLDFVWFTEVSFLTAATTLLAYWVGGRAMAFTTIILVQHFILLDVWGREKSFIYARALGSKIFLITFLVPLVFQILILYVPAFSGLFGVHTIAPLQLFNLVLLSSSLLVSSEIRKYVLHRKSVNR